MKISRPKAPAARMSIDKTFSLLIVGGAGVLASAISETFAARGARIAIQYGDDGDRNEAVRAAARVAREGGVALPIRSDLTEGREAACRLVRRIAEDFGRLDIVVFSAGPAADKSPVGMSKRDWDRVGALNLGAVAWYAQAAELYLRRSRPAGHFVVIGSLTEPHESADPSDDASAGEGLRALVRDLSLEWSAARNRACINAVVLPWLENAHGSAVTAAADHDEPGDAPRPRCARPQDVAQLILRLTARRGVSGQVFQVDSKT